jgi:hypothetical protein
LSHDWTGQDRVIFLSTLPINREAEKRTKKKRKGKIELEGFFLKEKGRRNRERDRQFLREKGETKREKQ